MYAIVFQVTKEILETVLVFLSGSTRNSVRFPVCDIVLHGLANSPRQLTEFLTTSKFDSTGFKELSYDVGALYDIFFPSVEVIIYPVSNQMVYECLADSGSIIPVSYTHLRAHETRHDLVCRLLLEKKKKPKKKQIDTHINLLRQTQKKKKEKIL